MKIAYFPNQTALQSEPVWQAFLEGARKNGFEPVENSMSADCAVIWSVLWSGRMRNNKTVYDHYRNQGKPIFIIEVGALKRGITWKISINNITSQGLYANTLNLDVDRPRKLGIFPYPYRQNRKQDIVIALQHRKSLQWQGLPAPDTWLREKISEIRKYSDRPIVVRPHPRDGVKIFKEKSVIFEQPKKIVDTYDEFDLKFDCHCLINHNSGPAIQAAINGVPVICDVTSLASPLSNKISEIEQLSMPDRTQWLIELSHTEWLLDEIRQGIPIERIKKELTF